MLTGIREVDGHDHLESELNLASEMEIDDDSDDNMDVDTSKERFICEIYRLEMIFGNMNSGKTSELIRRLKIKSLYKKVLAVNTAKDTRYGTEGVITHDGIVFPCVRVRSLKELLNVPAYKESKVIGIDEGNFYPDIFDFIVEQLELTGKTFIIAGLNGDKDKRFFGQLHTLIPHADKIDFLRALCKQCADGTEAPFTINLESFEGQEHVGGAEMYEAVCRKHYHAIRYQQAIDNLKHSKTGLKLSIE